MSWSDLVPFRRKEAPPTGRFFASWILAVVFVGVGGILLDEVRSASMDRFLATQRYESLYYLPSKEWLPTASLGHEEALADLLWMKSLVYIGDEYSHQGNLAHVFRYADAILKLDPDFRRVYSWACTMGLYRPIAPSMEDARTAVGYLETALTRFPDDAELYWELGAAYAFELPSFTPDHDEKARYREMGRGYTMEAARRGAGPPWLALSNASALEELGRRTQAIEHLEEMFALVDDDDTRREIASRLTNLREYVRAETLQRHQEEFERSARESYPWLPLDFTALVGPRIVR